MFLLEGKVVVNTESGLTPQQSKHRVCHSAVQCRAEELSRLSTAISSHSFFCPSPLWAQRGLGALADLTDLGSPQTAPKGTVAPRVRGTVYKRQNFSSSCHQRANFINCSDITTVLLNKEGCLQHQDQFQGRTQGVSQS